MTADSPREQLARFGALFAAGEFAEALLVIDALIAAMPGETPLQFQRARVLAQLERDDEARVAVKEVVARKPDHAGAWTL